ncbi:T7SS effector LXG polymorphic toxin [Granulicatella adiacens]|uniref:T7SS effector LXG polymorphic toxin n=2 Tax=Bacteria TaxID=2 RepID=UPI00352F2EEF
MYQVKFNDITSMHGQTNQTIQQWGESLKNLQESIASLANQSELQGKAMTSAKSYMTEVHGTFIQTLTLLMNEYTASFLLYKDGYYQIDTHNHAELPEDVYKGLYSDLGKSKQRFEQQLEQLTTAKLRVAGLVNYQGTSHTKTKFTYEKLMKDIKHLDESITQYEEMHVRQDLQAFKELLAATKSLLAEHSSRDRSMGSYQVGDFRQLPSMNRFMLAVQQSAIYLNNHMPQFQAAQEREQLRVESIYAEERTKQGLMNLVFGVLTLVAGATALVMPVGAMWPIVVSAFKYGALVLSMSGASNSIEAVQNIYYGLSGNGKSFAINAVRDIFFGKSEIYNTVESVLTLTTGVFIPIAQTKSIAQGVWQFTWGFVGSLATGQAAYHGTKLLGGNEETAQLMNLFGNLVGGGYAAYKAANKFSLNKVKNNVSELNFANYKEFLTKKIDEFKTNLKDVETKITVETRNASSKIQRIQLKAIGIDETGNIRIQDYTTAEHVSPEIKKAAFAKFRELASKEMDWNTPEKQASFMETFDMYAERAVREGAVPNKETYYKQYVARQYDYPVLYKEAIKQSYLESGASSVVNGQSIEDFVFGEKGSSVGRVTQEGIGQGNFTTSIVEDSALLYDESGNLKSAREIARVKGVGDDTYDSGIYQYEYSPELVRNMDKKGWIQFANGVTPGSSSLNIPGAKTWAGSDIHMSESELLMPSIDMKGHSYDDFLSAIERQGYYEIKNPRVYEPGTNKIEQVEGIFRINQWSK